MHGIYNIKYCNAVVAATVSDAAAALLNTNSTAPLSTHECRRPPHDIHLFAQNSQSSGRAKALARNCQTFRHQYEANVWLSLLQISARVCVMRYTAMK